MRLNGINDVLISAVLELKSYNPKHYIYIFVLYGTTITSANFINFDFQA